MQMEWKSIHSMKTLDGEDDEVDMPPTPPMPSANAGAAASSAPAGAVASSAPADNLDGLPDEMPTAVSAPQDIASTPAKSKPAALQRSDEDDLAPPPPMLSASMGSADMPPRSPPPMDDMVPSAQPPEAKLPVRSPPPLDELRDEPSGKRSADQKSPSRANAGQMSKEEQELGDVLKHSAPPLSPLSSTSLTAIVEPRARVSFVHFGEPLRSLTKDGEESDTLRESRSVEGEESSASYAYGGVKSSPSGNSTTLASASQSISSLLFPWVKPSESMVVHRASENSGVQSCDPTSRMGPMNSLFVHSPSTATLGSGGPTTSASFQTQGSYSIGPANSMFVNAASESLAIQAQASVALGPANSMFVNTASTTSTSSQFQSQSSATASTSSQFQSQSSAIIGSNSMYVHHPSDSDIFVRSAPSGNRSAPADDGDFGLRPCGLAPPGKESPLQRALCTYSTLLSRCPCCFIFMYIIFFAVLIGAAWHPLEVDSDFSSFIRADGEAMRRRDAYTEALSVKKKQQSGRRLQDVLEGLQWKQSEQSVDSDGNEAVALGETRRLRQLSFSDVELTSQEDAEWLHESHKEENGRMLLSGSGLVVLRRVLTLTYMPESRNAFDSRLLKGVRDFEAGLRSMASWKETCGKVSPTHQFLCNPGESFIAYAYPTRTAPAAADANSTFFQLTFDAVGEDALQIPAALAVLQQSSAEMHNMYRFFPKDYVAPAIGTDMSGAAPPSAMRTHYTFYLVVGRRGGSLSEMRKNTGDMMDLYDKLITDEVFPLVQNKEIEGTRVLYSGDVITSYEVSRTLRLDAQWAVGSVVFVTLYLWLHTGSFLLSISSLGIIFTAVPLAYVLTPASKTTVASFLSLFLVTGIGCDVVFVFTDCWEQSYMVEKTRSRRLAWTLLHAGRNCLATSLTTAASFFANLASALQPLREFGLFMGLSVFGAFVLVALFLPPLIVLRESCCSGSTDDSLATIDDAGEIGSMAIVPSAPLPAVLDASAKTQGSKGRGPKKNARMQRLLLWLMDKLAACPCFVAIATVIAVLVFMIGVATSYELDNEVPDIFPADHNQIREAKAQELFGVVKGLENLDGDGSGPACRPNAEWTSDWSTTKSNCLLHWCEAPYATTTSSTSNSSSSPVTCWWNKARPKCRRVEFRTRLAATSRPIVSAWDTALKGHVKSTTDASAVSYLSPSWGTRFNELNTLALENWETGGMETRRFYSAGSVVGTYLQYPVVRDVATTSPTCSVGDSVSAKWYGNNKWYAATIAAHNSDSSFTVNWNDGDTSYREVAATDVTKGGAICQQVSQAPRTAPPTTEEACIVDQICYQGEMHCAHDGWITNGSTMHINFQPPVTRRALQELQTEKEVLEAPDDRHLLTNGFDTAPASSNSLLAPMAGHRMLASLVPVSKRIDVTVLWGVRPARSTPLVGAPSELWSFDPTFEPNNPWAQRAILAMCDSANLNDNLLIIESRCWIDQFRNYLMTSSGGNDRFPTRNFESQVDKWFPTTIRGAEDLWRDGKKVQALKLTFILNLAYDIAAQPLLDHRNLWDDYIASLNGAASVTGNRAYHTAEAWVRAEAEIAVVSSTLNTIIVSAVSAWIGMLLFTQDPVLSFLVLSLVLGIICGLAFFMVVIMQWKFGSIEVISLVIFVGYSVTYSLHVAHSYAEAREPQQSGGPDPESPLCLLPADAEERLSPSASRKLRSRMAIAHIGASVFSSALSTLGSSIMLLFCTMVIFVKLGWVVIAVTFLSVVCALIILPALLMIMGPSPEPWCKRCVKWLTRTRARLKRA